MLSIRDTFLQSRSRMVESQGQESIGEVLQVRVLDVIMDDTHPMWDKCGRELSQYGVFYQMMFQKEEEKLDPERNFAYCDHKAFRRIPVKDETVVIEIRTTHYSTGQVQEYESRQKATFWTEIVPVWHSVHYNPYQDVPRWGNPRPGEDFIINPVIRPLQLNPGDNSVEGRHGCTIRFGGTKWKQPESLAKEINNGKPYMVLRVGQRPLRSPEEYAVYEQPNEDSSSLYLTTMHKVELEEAVRHTGAWYQSKRLPKAKDYGWASESEPQILANTDRIFLNARKHDIELAAKDAIGIDSDTHVSIDGSEYIALDAPEIHLGTVALNLRKNAEPILKGKSTAAWLGSLCDAISNYCVGGMASAAVSIDPGFKSHVINLTALMVMANKLKSQIPGLQSKKAFVE